MTKQYLYILVTSSLRQLWCVVTLLSFCNQYCCSGLLVTAAIPAVLMNCYLLSIKPLTNSSLSLKSIVPEFWNILHFSLVLNKNSLIKFSEKNIVANISSNKHAIISHEHTIILVEPTTFLTCFERFWLTRASKGRLACTGEARQASQRTKICPWVRARWLEVKLWFFFSLKSIKDGRKQERGIAGYVRGSGRRCFLRLESLSRFRLSVQWGSSRCALVRACG